MKYQKKFQALSELQAYQTSADYILPNTLYCVEDGSVQYHKWTGPKIIATFTVTDASNPTQIVGAAPKGGYVTSVITELEIDGVVVTPVTGTYQLSIGKHTIKYSTVHDGYDVPNYFFAGCSQLTSVKFPEMLQTIELGAFESCVGLTSIVIPKNIVRIGAPDSIRPVFSCFEGCANITSYTILAATPPALESSALVGTNNFKIYVPENSVNAYKSAPNWSYYASRIRAIQQ